MARRRGGGWRAARPCRRGRSAGAGAGSRAVTDGPAPPAHGRRGGLACRPGPQASTLHSGHPVKPASAPTALAPGPRPQAGGCRCPPRQQGAAPHEGRPPGGYRVTGTVASTAKVRAATAPAPAAWQPGQGMPGCGQRVMLLGGSVIVGWSRVPPY